MIKRLAHVCFFTDKALELVAFYQEAFGFPIAFEMKSDEGITFGWYLDCGEDTFVEIFDQEGAVAQWGGESTELRQERASHFKHICFEIDDLTAFRESLARKGVDITEIKMGMDHSYQCWIKDTDGNDIELMQYTEKSLQFSRR